MLEFPLRVFISAIAVLLVLQSSVPAQSPSIEDASTSDEASVQLAANLQGSPSRRQRSRSTSYKISEVKAGGSIAGTIQYKGLIPPPRKIQLVKDHETCKQHPEEVPLIATDKDGRVAEAVVFLANISEGKGWTESDAKPVIDQKTCEFHPHVQVVRARQPVEIVNSDPVAHNINASQRIFTLFNILQPQQGMKATQQFDKPGVVNLRCNVHDWMQAYVHVAVHPYFAVTAADGAFKLEDVPAGKYELAVWQEYLGEQLFEVEVKPGETTEMKVVLKPKPGEEGGSASK